jgi:hypothetical protein
LVSLFTEEYTKFERESPKKGDPRLRGDDNVKKRTPGKCREFPKENNDWSTFLID